MSLRLHEAIRLGATLKEQAFNALLTLDKMRTCAYGAALDAAGLLVDNNIELFAHGDAVLSYCLKSGNVSNVIPFAFAKVDLHHTFSCPACSLSYVVERSTSIIVHLNDVHRWTRNAIADYIQPIEEAWWAQQEAQSQTTERKEEPICT